MNFIKLSIGIALFLLLTSCKEEGSKTTVLPKVKKEWKSIFNGKDLTGWTIRINKNPVGVNYKNTFSVEDGIMKVSYADYKGKFGRSFGHIFYNEKLNNYRLRLQYRFVGDQEEEIGSWAIKNSGIMLHSQSPVSMAVNQEFPVSLEAQLLGGYEAGNPRPTGNICTPGMHIMMDGKFVTEHCINSTSETFYGEEWIDFEVLVLSDSLIVQYINGKEVSRCSKPVYGGEYTPETTAWKTKEGKPVKDGYIALQSESHPIEFRKIELMKL